jgi:arginyl-tRNA synthetase
MLIGEIKSHLLSLIRKNLPDLPEDFVLDLDIPPQPEMGDLAVPCFAMSKLLKKSPGALATALSKNITHDEVIARMSHKGPYLNFFLKKDVWFKVVCEEILSNIDNFGNSGEGKDKKILIEYSGPNTNKPQHLGHLRNNFIGSSVANLFSALNFETVRANIINDRGIHICKSMLAYQKWGKGRTPESEKIKPDHFVGQYYVMFGQKVGEDPKLMDEAQELLRKWEAGDNETLLLWQKMNKWAIDGLKQTYKKIGVDFDKYYYESETYKSGKDIVLKAVKDGMAYKREDGAVEIDLTQYGLDKKVLLRADGTSVYVTQDIGLAVLRQKEYSPDRMIYVVGSEQDYHFKVLFNILAIFGYEWAKNLYHLSHGMISLSEGRMKSREGVVVDADDLIAELEKLVKGEVLAREPNISPIELDERAEKIALAALKFFFLKINPKQNFEFNPKESIALEGATGPYIQYTYARIQSILKKAAEEKIDLTTVDYTALGEPSEVEVIKSLFIFPDVLQRSATSMDPSYLANYLLKLCQNFNEFYHKYQVLQADENIKKARLNLISAVAKIINKGLGLLGIQAIDKM